MSGSSRQLFGVALVVSGLAAAYAPIAAQAPKPAAQVPKPAHSNNNLPAPWTSVQPSVSNFFPEPMELRS